MDTFRKKSKSKNWIKEVEDKFRKMFENMEGMPYADHVDREMYMVDNTVKSHEGIKQLRRNVGRYMKAMVRSIPLKWGDLQEQLQGIGKTTLCITFTETSKIGTQCGISKDGLSTAIAYLNDIGVIMYSSTNKKLRNTVITNLYMMLEMVTRVITVKRPVIKVKELRMLWNKLNKEGILEEKLLRHLWKHELQEDSKRFEIFTEVMKTFGLLYEKLQHRSEDNRMFLVPSRMQNTKESLKVEKDEKHTLSMYLTPTDFLPNAVYNTLVVAFLYLMESKGRRGDQVVFQNRSDFDFGDHEVRLGAVNIEHQRENKHALKLEISRRIEVDDNNTEVIYGPQPSLCIEVLRYLTHQLKTVLKTNEGIGYNLRVLCIACHTAEHIHLHDLEKCLKEDTVPCGRKSMKTDRLKYLLVDDTVEQEDAAATGPTGTTAKRDINTAVCLPETLPLAPLNTDLSDEAFLELLVDLSSWVKDEGNVHMLKLLLLDFNDIAVAAIEKEGDPFNLFRLLVTTGRISSTNVDLIIECFSLCGWHGAANIIKQKMPCFNGFVTGITITKFSQLRQNLILFGRMLNEDKRNAICRWYKIAVDQIANEWDLLFELDKRYVFNDMGVFIDKLERNRMMIEANVLKKGLGL
ncbi:uncharacterized protein [Antedon mediterranea]|uniref:uncharacterized protein n=1 Tax=Antedon mediterranea TaxID=105859 RepID=UPI003AF56A3E